MLRPGGAFGDGGCCGSPTYTRPDHSCAHGCSQSVWRECAQVVDGIGIEKIVPDEGLGQSTNRPVRTGAVSARRDAGKEPALQSDQPEAARKAYDFSMDKSKYTLAAHAGMDFANPFSSATIDRAVELLALGAISVRPRVIDVGSGNGELSSRIARRWEAQVDAVDASAGMCAEARRRGAGTGVTVHESDAGEFARRAAGGTYHGAVCIGSSHALRGTEPMIRELARLVARGGVVLIGEGVWEQAPSKEYLKETGPTDTPSSWKMQK